MLAAALSAHGWSCFALDALSDESDSELVAMLANMGYDAADLAELRGLIAGAAPGASQAQRRFANASEADLDYALQVKRDTMEAAASSSRALVAARQAPAGTATYQHWPSRVKRSLVKAKGDTALRQQLEDRERTKWAARLAGIISAARLPAALDTAGQLCELGELKRSSKGRRSSTLKAHVRYCEGFLVWLSIATGLLWPSSPRDVIKYLEMRSEEPCGRTVPGTIQRALIFVESAGEVAACDTVATHPSVINLLEELSTSLGTAVRSKRKAWQLPVSMVIFWECVVCDTEAETFVRGFAWFKLVKLWTGMRWSDTVGLPPSSLRLDKRGLAGVLDRTKTTGAGKRVEQLCIYVSFCAFLEHCNWLEIGFQLWR